MHIIYIKFVLLCIYHLSASNLILILITTMMHARTLFEITLLNRHTYL